MPTISEEVCVYYYELSNLTDQLQFEGNIFNCYEIEFYFKENVNHEMRLIITLGLK